MVILVLFMSLWVISKRSLIVTSYILVLPRHWETELEKEVHMLILPLLITSWVILKPK